MDRNHPGFKKEAEPFFRIVMEGLKGEVDGEHFWDAVAEDAVFEFLHGGDSQHAIMAHGIASVPSGVLPDKEMV